MLLLVTERFKPEALPKVHERFLARGRLLPPDVIYISSWIDEPGTICYQLMRAPSRQALDPWLHAWNDLVEFDVVPVLSSEEFWKKYDGADEA